MQHCNNMLFFFILFILLTISNGTSNLFREYIGAELEGIKFTDVPINPSVEFHFILAFAIDYTQAKRPAPTNGKFNTFWYTQHLGPVNVSSIKSLHKNVRVAVSLGGDTVTGNHDACFAPTSTSSWVSNAVASLTQIIKMYNLDGIDIDYEHFDTDTDPDTFANCIGQLITILKKDRVISFASIAPFEDDQVQSYYQALWRKYGQVIDYVNFQFYASKIESVNQFLGLFDRQQANYEGGRILASFATDPEAAGGLEPENGFFEACKELKKQGKLGGIFVWSADDSMKKGYMYEELSQEFLASA